MSVREYVGARYVPTFATPIDWNSANTYEPLTIVLHEGNSYTSRQAVPAGIQITNTAYWAQTGNYNAQIEQYRQDVAALASRFPVSVLDGGTGGTDAATARTNLDAAQADGATNTLYDAEQAIAANAADIISLQDSVLQIHSVTNSLTFASGYSGDTVARYAGLLKSINFKITPSSRLTVGTKYSVGMVASELVPRVHTSVFALCNDDYVYVDITVEGRVEVTPKSGDVNAGTNIWIRHTYM